jgi:hypothetical protein
MSEQKSNHHSKRNRRRGAKPHTATLKMIPATRAERYPSTWILSRQDPFPVCGAFDNQAYSVIDGFQNLAVLTTSTVGNTFVGITATLSSFNDYASYTAVFDQYRIRGMEVQFSPSNSGQLTTTIGHVHSVIDYDDGASITPAQALDYSGCIVSNLTDTFVRSFKPHIALAAYAGGVFTSFANTKDVWLDCSSTGVVHYGLKVAVDPTSVAIQFDSIVRCWIEFRNPR